MEVKLVVLEFVMMVVVMVVVMVLRPWGRAGSGIGQRKFQKARTSWRIALGITRAKGGKAVVSANDVRPVNAINLEAGLSLLMVTRMVIM